MDLSCKKVDLQEIRNLLKEAVPGFESSEEAGDHLLDESVAKVSVEGEALAQDKSVTNAAKVTPLFKD